MLKKPDGCQACPLFEKGQGYVPDKLYADAEYIIYGEAPGKKEIVVGEPFVGDSGFVLQEWLLKFVPLLKLANERKKISYCNTLRCLPPEQSGRPYPRGVEKLEAERCCSQYVNLGKATTIILCGESPQRYFFGTELQAEDATDRALGHDVKGVMGRIGRVIERDAKRWIFAPHPAYILRQPALVQHGQQALAIAANTERVVDVDYIEWSKALTALGVS